MGGAGTGSPPPCSPSPSCSLPGLPAPLVPPREAAGHGLTGTGIKQPPWSPDVLQSRVVVVSWGWMLSAAAASPAAQGCDRGPFLGGRRSAQIKVLHLL